MASPVISVNSGSICAGNSFTIVPGGANTYTIQGGNSVMRPTISSSYTVIGTDALGCTSTSFATSNVTVDATPLPTVTVNSGSICSGSSFTIVPAGAFAYNIQGGSAVVTPTSNSSYTVVGTNTAGCASASFATSNITVSALPSVSITAPATLCVGMYATLTASGTDASSSKTGTQLQA